MASISRKEIPLTMPLYDSLGFHGKDGRSSQVITQATYAWRRHYLGRFGLALKDLLDWDKDRNQFRSIAATFLMNDRNGETYWPSGRHSGSDIPEYPRDQALLVDLLSQLFWRQIKNEHQCRDRDRSHKDSSDSAAHSRILANSYDNEEQPELAQHPASPLHNNNSNAQFVPKVPVFHENWDWPHSQVGRTRSATLPAANAARPTEHSLKNLHDVKPRKVPIKGSTGSSRTSARNVVDFTKNDGIGHPSSDGTVQESLSLPQGNSTALPSTPYASDEHDNIKIENFTDFGKYSGRLSFWKRERDIHREGQPRSSMPVTNPKRSRLSLGPHSRVATGPSPYVLGDGSAGAKKLPVSESNYGQTATTASQGPDKANPCATVSKTAEIHYNIITARKPRLCSVTWTGGGLSNRSWAGLLQEVSQYIEGAYVEGITFTLQMRNAAYETSVDRQDENTFIHMRNRWTRIIKEEMAEGVSSVFEVELEPKHRARFEKVDLDENLDITL